MEKKLKLAHEGLEKLREEGMDSLGFEPNQPLDTLASAKIFSPANTSEL
jgi:hypothetical protein